ncbi:ribosomal protein S7 [Microthyrium microscopicum]|uniref:Ribosomal protein S7 n=1 Tax=Microthyrium microscopicum TaxID=703497 RepID=A0A6A6URG8_9PEZI|nr:ribosomal protein S7 [Microthyrium microscopicum]
MPPRINIISTARNLAFRSKHNNGRTCHASRLPTISPYINTRSLSSSKDLPTSPDQKGPNTDPQSTGLPSVSEEANMTSKIEGGKGPDLEQGTPVQEVVKRDPEAQKHLPKVMKEELKKSENKTPGSTRQFSTYARQREELTTQGPPSTPDAIVGAGMESLDTPDVLSASEADELAEFENDLVEADASPLPALKPDDIFTKRYPAIIDQLVGQVQAHGKKSVAQKNVATILSILRSSPPPKLNPARPLLPGHPPASFLPLNPILYLTLAIDSLAPLIRLRAEKGAAGGGASLLIPMPLQMRQRRFVAMKWVLDAARKRKDKTFPHRVADVIVSVVEGKSALWERRMNLHKMGVASRVNVNYFQQKSGRKRRM